MKYDIVTGPGFQVWKITAKCAAPVLVTQNSTVLVEFFKNKKATITTDSPRVVEYLNNAGIAATFKEY
jgi:hypothetical protein